MTHEEVYADLIGRMKKAHIASHRAPKNGRSSILFFNSLAAHIYIGARTQYILLYADGDDPVKRDLTPENIPDIVQTLDEIWGFNSLYPDVDMFGCCSSFMACSDARCCLHLDEIEYYGCCYKRNLEAGRIFYGENRNS